MENSAGQSVQDEATHSERQVLREDLVNTAAKFLQSPKVRDTPLTHQKAFLAKKGLTETEIQAALSRAEVSAVGPAVAQHSLSPYHNTGITAAPLRPPPLTWRDYATAMMFISGASYVAYTFVRRHVLPSWFNVPDPEQERLRRLDEGINDVQSGLKFLVDSVQQTLGVVQQQQETLNRLMNQLIEKDRSVAMQERTIQELKGEVTTIKSLLLSRDQFPPLPSVPTPALPAWQLASNVRQPSLVNGTHGPDSKRMLSSNGDEDDVTSADGYAASEETYVSAAGSENGEKMTPV